MLAFILQEGEIREQMMKIGNVSGVYLNYPIQEAVRRIAAAGYDSIDV
jgi:hypothetical protein